MNSIRNNRSEVEKYIRASANIFLLKNVLVKGQHAFLQFNTRCVASVSNTSTLDRSKYANVTAFVGVERCKLKINLGEINKLKIATTTNKIKPKHGKTSINPVLESPTILLLFSLDTKEFNKLMVVLVTQNRKL